MNAARTTDAGLPRLLERWVPEDLEGEAERAHAALFVYGTGMTVAAIAVLDVVGWFTGSISFFLHVVAMALGVALVTSVGVLHLTANFAAAVNLAVGSTFGMTLGVLLLATPHTHASGGLLFAEALVAAWLLGRAWRPFWIAMAAGGYAALALAATQGDLLPVLTTLPTDPGVWLVIQLWLVVEVAGIIALIERDEEHTHATVDKLRVGRDAMRERMADLEARYASINRDLARASEALQDAEQSQMAAMLATNEAEEATAEVEAGHKRLVHALGHEVRTPITSSMGALQVLMGTPLVPDQRRLVETSLAASEGLLRLLDDFGDIRAAEQGQLNVANTGFSVRDIVEEVRASREGLALGLGLSWEAHVDTDVPQLLVGDPARIRQVLYRLVDNAFQHTTSGGVLVDVRIQDDRVRFGVSDTGSGLPGDDATTVAAWPDRIAPTGDAAASVGLMVCRGIVEAMSGTVGALGANGVGATFWFVLPLATATQNAEQLSTMRREAHTLPAGLHVLLVEDNPVNRMVAERLLVQMGCRVRVAADGMEAVQAYANEKPDVVLMDIHLPVLDGLEATRVIRAEEEDGVQVPIIAVTADAHADQREACLRAGMDDHVTKPFRVDDLVQVVKRVLEAYEDEARAVVSA